MDPIARMVEICWCRIRAVGGVVRRMSMMCLVRFYMKQAEQPQTITNGIDLDGEGGLVWIKTEMVIAIQIMLL